VGNSYDTSSRNGNTMCVPLVILVVEAVILFGYLCNIGGRTKNIIWGHLVTFMVERGILCGYLS